LIAVLVRTAAYINSEEDAGDVYEGAGDVEETTKSIKT
jgi:hypothetical protein